jgi:hypothetical protein
MTILVYLCSHRTPNIQINYFTFEWSIYRLFVLNRTLDSWFFLIMIFVYVRSTWSIVELNRRFETWMTRNDVNGVCLFNLPYVMTIMAYLCSQRTPYIQIKYFILDWPIYILFVLNRCWKRVSLQIMIVVYVYLTWDIVELKTRFEMWITRNDVNDVSMFNLSYVVTIMAYLCSQRTPNIQIKYFMFDWSLYRLFVLNRGWKPVSLQIMVLVYVC